MIILIFLCIACILLIIIYSLWLTHKFSFPVEFAPSVQYTLVLGAGIEKNGQLTDILADRVITACELFHTGKTTYLIMSGTFNNRDYNEPEAMKNFARSHGVTDSAIRLDKAGFTTFRSCINVLYTYKPKELLIVTQFFHLPRALLIARALGIEAMAVPASAYHFSFINKFFWSAREFLAIPINLLRLTLFYINQFFN